VFSHHATAPSGPHLLIIDASRTHPATSHSVGLPWTSDKPDAETSTYTTHNIHKRQIFMHHHHHWLDNPWWALAFLTLILLTWKIRWAPNNNSKWQMGFNSAFKGLRSFAHSSLSRATFFQFLTSNILISWSTPSSHRSFGLPTLLTPSGLVFNFFKVLQGEHKVFPWLQTYVIRERI